MKKKEKNMIKNKMKVVVKGILLFSLFSFSSLTALAQQETENQADDTAPMALFGYLSYEQALQSMPEINDVKANLQRRREQFDAEMRRAEEDFNRKYEDFLEGQRSFEPSIFKKRQAELTDIMQKNMAFKKESKKMLAIAEKDAMKRLEDKLALAIANVGKRKSLAFILNTDNNALPYVDAFLGQDVTEDVIAELRKK